MNRRAYTLVTAPEVEPVTLEQVKAYLKVDDTSEDALIDLLITSARQTCENYTRRAFITQTHKLTLDNFINGRPRRNLLECYADGVYDFPSNYDLDVIFGSYIDLALLPIQSITSIVTYNTANTSSTFSSSSYRLDATTGRIYLNAGYSWPTSLRDYAAVEVTLVAGYGDDPSDVPAGIRQAVMLLTAAMYENRGICEMPANVKGLLDAYKLYDRLGLSQ